MRTQHAAHQLRPPMMELLNPIHAAARNWLPRWVSMWLSWSRRAYSCQLCHRSTVPCLSCGEAHAATNWYHRRVAPRYVQAVTFVYCRHSLLAPPFCDVCNGTLRGWPLGNPSLRTSSSLPVDSPTLAAQPKCQPIPSNKLWHQSSGWAPVRQNISVRALVDGTQLPRL